MKDIHDSNEFDDVDVELEEVVQEESELEDIEENSTQKIKKLKQELKESEKEKMEHLENLQRAKAEFLNAKRRLEEERQIEKERSVNSLIEKLLPMSDSFQMARSDKDAWEAIDATWRKGIESIHTQLQSILASYGVSEIHPVGEVFDPSLHDAMTNIQVEDKKDHHKVMQVVQNGYSRTVNGKTFMIRPARVVVGEFEQK